MFRRRAGSRRALATPYKRTATTDDRWVHAAMLRQLFQQALDHDESKVAVCEVSMVFAGGNGKAVTAWAAATDRALHVRLTLGPGIHQTLRLPYDQVKYVEASASGEASLQVTYFDPQRAADESWHLHWDRTVSTPDLGVALVHLVSRHHAPSPAAVPAALGVTAGGAVEDIATVAAAADRLVSSPVAAVGSQVASPAPDNARAPVSVLVASSQGASLRRLSRHRALRAPSPSRA